MDDVGMVPRAAEFAADAFLEVSADRFGLRLGRLRKLADMVVSERFAAQGEARRLHFGLCVHCEPPIANKAPLPIPANRKRKAVQMQSARGLALTIASGR